MDAADRAREIVENGGTNEEAAEVMEALCRLAPEEYRPLDPAMLKLLKEDGRAALIMANFQRLAPEDYPLPPCPVPAKLSDNALPVPAQIVEGAQKPITPEDAQKRRGPRLKLSKKDDGSVNLAYDWEPVTAGSRYRAFAASIGANNSDFCHGILSRIISAANANEDTSNFALAVIQSIAPRDATESLLATQMTAVHVAAMTAAYKLAAQSDTLAKYEAFERAFNKLSRTFTAQMEALRRYRGGGEQRMIVEHVNVGAGGQAIVGNVTR